MNDFYLSAKSDVSKFLPPPAAWLNLKQAVMMQVNVDNVTVD